MDLSVAETTDVVEAQELNPLLALTPALLHLISGDRRNRLITYLKHWNEHATLLRYLDTWLAAQPELATLRQARSEALIGLGQPAPALAELDAIDQERETTKGRRQLRLAAYLAAKDWAAATMLINPENGWERGDLLLAQGDAREAARAYAQAAMLREAAPSPREIRAALLGGDARRAQGLLAERCGAQNDQRPTTNDQRLDNDDQQSRTTGQRMTGDQGATLDGQRFAVRPSIEELRLQEEIAKALDDEHGVDEARAALAAIEATERAQLVELLGLGEHIDLEVVPDVPATEPGNVAVPDEALKILRDIWGYPAFRGGQAATVNHVLDHRSALAVLPTGAGKSLCYQLPALLLDGATVVISPLIALMKDQLDGLPAAVRDRAVAINSSLSAAEAAQRLREVREGRFKLVYVAPERLRQQAFVHALRQAGIARLVVDEAHCVSLWGLSFRPDYLFIRRVIEELGHPPVLALTATATPDTRAEIVEQLGAMELVAASVFRPNLLFSVVHVRSAEAKTAALVEQCQAIEGPILVYARSRERCEELAHLLRRKGIKAGHYHAQVEDRARAQNEFMRGEVRVLVATVAFGMGVDKPDIRAIIHYNLPQSVEAYYQEAGRAGRDGLPSRCVLLYTSADKGQLTSWLRQEALNRDHLRAVYRTLRGRAVEGAVLMPAEELGRDLPELDETQLRVALGMLERAGLLVRHYDLAPTLRVTLLDAAHDPELGEFAAAAQLRAGIPTTIDTVGLAITLGRRPDQIEGDLLRWSAQGGVRVDCGARGLLIELLPAPADTPARIEGMLREYATRQDARVEAMAAYATGLSCRHRALAAHFGERLPACGDACDICRGERSTAKTRAPAAAKPKGRPVDAEVAAQSALRALRDLPFAVGRTGLQRILTGSVESSIGPERCAEWGRLESWTKTATNRLIDELIERGLLARKVVGEYPLLELTPAGYGAIETSAPNEFGA